LVAIDRPASGATTLQRFTVIGWAVDPEGTGSGVDVVHVYLDGDAANGVFMGAATYGDERPDVAQQLGQPRFALSGYQLQIEVAPGPHTVYVYARRQATGGPERWSLPATVDITAGPTLSLPEAGRSPGGSGGCPRAPDGSCLGRTNVASPTCAQIGPDGQCVPAAPGAVPPGVVGLPAGGPTPAPGICTQLDSSGRCLSYAGGSGPGGSGGPAASGPGAQDSALVLRGQTGGGMTTLTWGSVSGAQTYELLRCNSPSGQNCTSMAVISGTTYQLPRSLNTYYVVHARAAGGQVIATSNVVAS
jgi:hypothetical protein